MIFDFFDETNKFIRNEIVRYVYKVAFVYKTGEN